jgi:hypothetical protein
MDHNTTSVRCQVMAELQSLGLLASREGIVYSPRRTT